MPWRFDQVGSTTLNVNGRLYEIDTALQPWGAAIYETMVFADGSSVYYETCTTREEAVAQHQAIVEKARNGEIPFKDSVYWNAE